jgi:hypothetical protein
MQFRRILALGAMALATAACSRGTAVLPTTSAPTTVTRSTLPTLGEVCGVTALAGGPPGAIGVKNPALLHVCPSGAHEVAHTFSIIARNGKRYARTPTTTGEGGRPDCRPARIAPSESVGAVMSAGSLSRQGRR